MSKDDVDIIKAMIVGIGIMVLFHTCTSLIDHKEQQKTLNTLLEKVEALE